MVGASGRQRADKTVVENLEILVPSSISEQRDIAQILSTYDNLIENNTCRIQILEKMAQVIYTEWFVNFRFPDHEKVKMIDSGSDFGKIPEGRTVKKLGEKINISRGRNITKKTIEEGKVPVVAGGLEPAYYHSTANTVAPVITVSASGANAGFVNLYMENVWASDCSYIDKSVTPFVLYYFLLLKSRQVEVTGLQRGSAQPHVYPKDLSELLVVDVPDNLLKNFEDVIGTIFSFVGNLKMQNQALRDSRDLLLPKLVTGEIEVNRKKKSNGNFLSYLDTIHRKTNDSRLIDSAVRSKILNLMEDACKITSLSFSDLLQKIDHKPNDITIEALEAFLAELRAIFWLNDFGFTNIKPLKARKNSQQPDFTAKYQNKMVVAEVFCTTEAHEQQKDPYLNVYTNFDPGFEGSKFERDFITKANSKKKQLDSIDSKIKILLCVVNSQPMVSLNTKTNWEKHVKLLYAKLDWGNNYHIGIVTGANVNGISSNIIYPKIA